MLWRKITALSLLLGGCASRPIAHDRIPDTQAFWHGCTETVPANADGFHHFTCTDINQEQWEVLLRKEPKK